MADPKNHMKSTSTNSASGIDAIRLILAVFVSFALTLAIFALLLSHRGTAQPIQWWPQQLKISQGSATMDKETLTNIKGDATGIAFIDIPQIQNKASQTNYGQIRVLGEGLGSVRSVMLLAMESGETLKLQPSPLSRPDQLVFILDQNNSRLIRAVRLAFAPPFQADMTLSRIKMDPRAPSPPGEAWTTLWTAWLAREGWKPYSINFIVGGQRADTLTSPALAGMTWLLLAVAAWFLLGLFMRKGSTLTTGMALLLVIGLVWTIVDFRWQVDLWSAHARTLKEASSKNTLFTSPPAFVTDRIDRLADPIMRALPTNPARLMIVSENRMLRLRLRYALLPHNGYAEESNVVNVWPHLREGDYLLLAKPFSGARFDSSTSSFVNDQGSRKPARMLISNQGMMLLRIEGEAAES